MLYKDFVPSEPDASTEEMLEARRLWQESHARGEETPAQVLEIWGRRDAAGAEFQNYMRSDRTEILAKMLPEGTELDIKKMMDILHVYFWWTLDEDEPIDCFERFARDLNDNRFIEAVEVLHEEFRDRCYRQEFNYESDSEICDSASGVTCFRWYLELNKGTEKVAEILASPSERADKLNMFFFEALYGEEEFDSSDDDWDEERVVLSFNKGPDTHNLTLMLGQHAVLRLIDAGLDDIEAMDATAVLELEKATRSYGGNRQEKYEEYALFRDSGGDFEGFLKQEAQRIRKNKKAMKELVMDFEGPGSKLSEMSASERKAVVDRFIEENRDDYEKLEIMYQLKEDGVSPFYRRRMAEDLFPRDQRD